jgi:hypothetical protein
MMAAMTSRQVHWAFIAAFSVVTIALIATSFGQLRHGMAHSILSCMSFAMMLLYLPFQWRQIKRSLNYEDWKRQGRCLNCGYDLRATPDRCPECGTITKKT